MLHLVALVVPPVAILFCDKSVQAALNVGILVLTLLLSIRMMPVACTMCAAHALFVVHHYYADQRNQQQRMQEMIADNNELAARIRLAEATRGEG